MLAAIIVMMNTSCSFPLLPPSIFLYSQHAFLGISPYWPAISLLGRGGGRTGSISHNRSQRGEFSSEETDEDLYGDTTGAY